MATELRAVTFEPRDEPLRDDVRLLGELVGEVIREQGGAALFEKVESARTEAIRRREASSAGLQGLGAALEGLDAATAAEVVRAYSAYFQVVNLAERVHRIRRGRAAMSSDATPQSGSLHHAVQQLRSRGLSDEAIGELFAGSRVEPVFTAHPTEATRRVVLAKQERIAQELIARLDPTRTPHDERVSRARIREDITVAWQTEEHPRVRPTVADEREHVLYYVARVLYGILPALHERLDDALGGPESGSGAPAMPPLLRVGSWVGGDMDGNPNVDARTLRETLHRHRDLAVDRYIAEVTGLAHHLSQSTLRTPVSDAVLELGRRYRSRFPDVAESFPARYAGMEYRSLLKLVATRLQATRDGREAGYRGPEELAADVQVVADSLRQHGGEHAGLFRVRRLQRRIRAFGFHLATLDVRQDARELRDVMASLLDDPTWPARSAAERLETLHALLSGDAHPAGVPAAHTEDPRVAAALEVFRAIDEGRRSFGSDAVASYIISMARDVDDVLTVTWLAELAGLDVAAGAGLDIVPLFETVPDLRDAEEVLDRLFQDPHVAPVLAAKERRQMVMVGYSDSNKDGGIASARWALYMALHGMAAAADRHGVTLTVFHGRGGTVSRGGGLVHRAVAAMPASSLGGRLRLTEQGEVIDAKYGLPPIALRNLERMLGAVALRSAGADDAAPAPEWHTIADTIASAARGHYRALVYEHPDFKEYFRHGTPIDVIEQMAIGSRPASRRSGAGVEDLRAIPWVFSWTQCRAMLTGWYGLGTGIEAAVATHGAASVREAAEGWPFLDTLLGDVEMVLAKSDLEIAEMYADLVPAAARPVFDVIRAEYDRTVSSVLELRGSGALLDSEPTLQRSIRLRNPYVDPMSILQVDLLRRWRRSEREDPELFSALLATVMGIARGLQNTG